MNNLIYHEIYTYQTDMNECEKDDYIIIVVMDYDDNNDDNVNDDNNDDDNYTYNKLV